MRRSHVLSLSRSGRTVLPIVLALLASLAQRAAAANGTLAAEYFLLPSNHPDVGKGVDGSIVRGLFANRLAADHLPIATPFAKGYTGPSGPIHDRNAAGEVMWYASSGRFGVRRIASSDDRLPIDRPAFFPPGKTGDGPGNGYLAVHWSGSFTLRSAQAIGLKLGSDDDSWVYVDSKLVVDNGGVKPIAEAPYTVAQLTAGTHRLDVFYADRHGVGAQIALSTAFDVAPPARSQASLAAPKAVAMAKQIRATGRVAVYGIHFAFDKATITNDSDAVLADVAGVLRADRNLRLRIEGHTDSAGDAGYNRTLSQLRADAVKAYLTSKLGIAGSRLETRGFGPDRPIAPNATAAGRAKNRRVELARI
jgi:fibro-slime domain-containing protein